MKTICIAGKNDIAVRILLYCLDSYKDMETVVICNKNDLGVNGWQRSLRWYANKNNVRIVKLEDVYGITDLVFLSVEFDRIIQPERFASSKLFNIHFSLLPCYKGCHTSVLPILHGKKRTGVTFHRMDSGIDTGDIIEQDEIEILSSDTSYDLYKKLIDVGAKLVINNIPYVINGTEKSHKQKSEESTYYSKNEIDYAELQLNENATAYQVQNQVRAFGFRPYQLLSWRGEQLIDCEILSNRSQYEPGTIIENTDTYVIMSSIDYDVKLFKDVLEMLLVAIKKGENERAKELCLSEKIIDAQDTHGWSPLIVATYYGNVKMVKYLLNRGADIHVKNWNGTTLLMYAKDCGVNTGDWTAFKMLVRLGLKVDEKDYNGLSIIDYISNDKRINNVPDDVKTLFHLS